MLAPGESRGGAAIDAARTSSGRELAEPRQWPQTFRTSVAGRVRGWALGLLWLAAAMIVFRGGGPLPGIALLVVAGIYLRAAVLKSAEYVVTPDLLEVRSPDGKKERHPLAGARIERRRGRTGRPQAIFTSRGGNLVLNDADPGIAALTATLDALIHNRPAPAPVSPRLQLPPPFDKLPADAPGFALAVAAIAIYVLYRWYAGAE